MSGGSFRRSLQGQRPYDLSVPAQSQSALPLLCRQRPGSRRQRFRLRQNLDDDESHQKRELGDSTVSDASVLDDKTPHYDIL